MEVGAAVEAVRGEIAATLRGHNPHDHSAVDGALIALDGTREKSRVGANAMLATSLAVARAAAAGAETFSDAVRIGVEVFTSCATCCRPRTQRADRSRWRLRARPRVERERPRYAGHRDQGTLETIRLAQASG